MAATDRQTDRQTPLDIKNTHPVLGEADDGVEMAHDDDVNYGSLVAEQGHEGLLGDHGVPQPDHAVLAARSEQVHGSVQVETPHTLARTCK